jgi:DNA-binding CsgD family transcriptional regulator
VEHLRLFFYIVLLATGFGGVTVTAILWHRLRERLILLVLAIISFFSTGLLVFIVVYYLREILGVSIDAAGFVGYLNAAIVVLMYGGIFVATRWVAPQRRTVAHALAAIPVVAAYVVFGLIAPSVPSLRGWAQSHGGLVSVGSVLAAALYLGYSGFWLHRGSSSLRPASLAFFVRWLGRLLFGYAVLSAAATVVAAVVGVAFDPTDLLNYLLFVFWNVVAIAAFVQYLTHPVDLFEGGEVPQTARRRYNISNREAEVIVLISRGLSNKEIADELGVSFTTVRTHVYNVFQKTGASSRVELLRILSGK